MESENLKTASLELNSSNEDTSNISFIIHSVRETIIDLLKICRNSSMEDKIKQVSYVLNTKYGKNAIKNKEFTTLENGTIVFRFEIGGENYTFLSHTEKYLNI